MTGLPHSPEAESGLIARLLVNPSDIPGLVGHLDPSDFHDPIMGKAWGVMVDHASDARRIDAVTLSSAGVQLGDPLEFINRATTAPVAEYASIIRLDAQKRRTILALDRAKRMAREARDESGVMTAVQEAVTTVLSGTRNNRMRSLSEAIADYVPHQGEIAWGLPTLDRALPPMASGEMIVIAARANVGKSALMMELLLKMSKGSRLPVLLTSIEMSEHNLVTRISRRGLDQYRDGYNLILDDDPAATTASIRAKASQLRVVHGGVKAIAIDYIQILNGPGKDDYTRVTQISREVKAMGREFDCPVIALAQFNRNGENEGRKPRLSDLRDSGAIEQDADLVMGLWRPHRGSPHMTILILKHRNGPAGGELQLYFNLESVSVEEE